MNSDITDPPAAHGLPLFSAMLKQHAADFRVHEDLGIEFSGSGEHVYLHIEKTAMNTDEVASVLQESYSVSSADIGLCGLKDRHSVSSQWFSVRTAYTADVFENVAQQFNDLQQVNREESGGYVKSMRLLQNARHARKLKRGAHSGNRFVITLQNVRACAGHEPTLKVDVDQRLELIKACGFPGYIGAQRFGFGAQNVQRARQWFARPRKRCSRQQRSLWLSSARSALFNIVCAARVRDGSWQSLLEGEPAVLDGSRSFFSTSEDDVRDDGSGAASLESRIRDFDIHPSAPWWGRGRTAANDACAAFEAIHLEANADLCDGLERAGLAQERRALRARPDNLEHSWLSDDALELRFSLSPGVFATTLLRELACVTEPQR
ncbi:MAG: tRNA pseudouridine(13) synthase TruD [Granulosicoccus sp.]